MKVLAIGNSFSQDATHYLAQIANAQNVEIKVVNLYIGGCNLERHWKNICENINDYLLEIDGTSTEKYVSIKEALDMEDWDIIVTQQASHDSGLIDTYEPYLSNICDYIKKEKPKAKLFLQETWAYESDSMHPGFINYNQNQNEMYEKLKEAYTIEAEKNNMVIIPCGDVIQQLRKIEPFIYGHGGMSICRDGFHMNVIYGRYLLSAVWYKAFTGNILANNDYIPYTELAPNAICDIDVLNIIKNIVDGTYKDLL